MKTGLSMNMPEALSSAPVEITAAAVVADNEFEFEVLAGELPDRLIDRLNKYTEAITRPGSSTISEYKAMLVTADSYNYGVAVCGENEVSYAGIYPTAKEWLEQNIEKMTDFACALKDLPDSNVHLVPLEMLGDYTDMKVTADNGVGELLLQRLKSRAEIADVHMCDGGFEIQYAGAEETFSEGVDPSDEPDEDEGFGMTMR